MSATGPAAVETYPVCGSPMARGERLRVQVLREALGVTGHADA